MFRLVLLSHHSQWASFHATKWRSGQMQFRELQLSGIHHLQDPKQVLLMGSQVKIVNAVLTGEVDVGFVRTDQLERTIDATTGELLDLSKIKILRPLEGLVSDGGPFPFDSTSRLYPEWNLAGLPHVPEPIRQAVQSALWQLDKHAALAPSLEPCFVAMACIDDTELCYDACFQSLDDEKRKPCGASTDIALAAQAASAAGKYAGWRSSESYMELRNMHQEVGFIRFNEEMNTMRCNRDTELACCLPRRTFQEKSI